MERSHEGAAESPAYKLEKITRQIEELEEKRHMVTRDLDVQRVPEMAQQVEEIDHQLMQLRIEEEYLKGETE